MSYYFTPAARYALYAGLFAVIVPLLIALWVSFKLSWPSLKYCDTWACYMEYPHFWMQVQLSFKFAYTLALPPALMVGIVARFLKDEVSWTTLDLIVAVLLFVSIWIFSVIVTFFLPADSMHRMLFRFLGDIAWIYPASIGGPLLIHIADAIIKYIDGDQPSPTWWER